MSQGRSADDPTLGMSGCRCSAIAETELAVLVVAENENRTIPRRADLKHVPHPYRTHTAPGSVKGIGRHRPPGCWHHGGIVITGDGRLDYNPAKKCWPLGSSAVSSAGH